MTLESLSLFIKEISSRPNGGATVWLLTMNGFLVGHFGSEDYIDQIMADMVGESKGDFISIWMEYDEKHPDPEIDLEEASEENGKELRLVKTIWLNGKGDILAFPGAYIDLDSVIAWGLATTIYSSLIDAAKSFVKTIHI